MNIAYLPYENNSNKYIEISESIIKEFGHNLYDYANLSFKELEKCDAVILNWYESLPGSRYPFLTEMRVVKRIVTLLRLRGKHVKIITTFHNRMPHDAKGLIGREARYLLKKVLYLSDSIIILSSGSVNYLKEYISDTDVKEKAFLIPHPNYIGVYGNVLQNKMLIESPKMKILFMGQVRRYKNVELIIEIARKLAQENIEFTIAGKTENETYKQELTKKTENLNNVKLDLRFIEDNEIPKLLSENHLLVLPYNIKSSMNSGTVIMAFSYMKTVICPNIPTLQEYDPNLYYSYDYNDETEHSKVLQQEIMKAYADWSNDKSVFEKKGKRLYELVKVNNSKERITKCYSDLLQSIK